MLEFASPLALHYTILFPISFHVQNLTLLRGKKLLSNFWMFDLHFLLGVVDDLRVFLLLFLVNSFGVEKAVPECKVQGIVVLRQTGRPVKCHLR